MSRRALTRPPIPGATLDARVSKIERAAVQVDVTFITPLEEKRKKKRLRQRFSGGSFQGGDEGDLTYESEGGGYGALIAFPVCEIT